MDIGGALYCPFGWDTLYLCNMLATLRMNTMSPFRIPVEYKINVYRGGTSSFSQNF